MRPALRYFGGKFRIAPWVVSHFPPHRIYCEPYGGAASVLMRKPRSYAEVYNDLDLEVVNFFRVLRDKASSLELERVVRLTPFSREEFECAYEITPDPVENARRLLIRSFMGFGGNGHNIETKTGFRRGAKLSYTSPPTDWKNWPNHLAEMTERLKGVTIENRAAIDVITANDSIETLTYCDPPYVHSTRGKSNGVLVKHEYLHEMDEDAHAELAAVLHGCVGMVVVSGYASDLYDCELYRGWHRVTKASLADGAAKRTEVLWLNESASKVQSILDWS